MRRSPLPLMEWIEYFEAEIASAAEAETGHQSHHFQRGPSRALRQIRPGEKNWVKIEKTEHLGPSLEL